MQFFKDWGVEHKGVAKTVFTTVLFTIVYSTILLTILHKETLAEGVLVETLGFLPVFIFTFWYLDKRRYQEQKIFEQQVLQNQAEIRTLLMRQQTNSQPDEPPTSEPTSQTLPQNPTTTFIFAGVILTTLLIIFLRRTHKP